MCDKTDTKESSNSNEELEISEKFYQKINKDLQKVCTLINCNNFYLLLWIVCSIDLKLLLLSIYVVNSQNFNRNSEKNSKMKNS